MNNFWQNKSVFITGHTGFKGSWLSKTLLMFNAEVHGYSREPITTPSLFNVLNLKREISTHHIGEINDKTKLSDAIKSASPDVIFHLAAQPLVIPSYQNPIETWNTNVLGTLNLLEILKTTTKPCTVIIITTDKVYENNNFTQPFTELDPLGGYDPYSASKAACEICVNSFRNSFCKDGQPGGHLKIATARAGNVIGGGDWSKYRLIPDLARAYSENKIMKIRNPNSIRPWQHVLESISGYLSLARHLHLTDELIFQSAYNFGPIANDIMSVDELITETNKHWDIRINIEKNTTQPYEAPILSLDSSKAHQYLNWSPKWNSREAIIKTLKWYQKFFLDEDFTFEFKHQIEEYFMESL